MYQQCTAQTSAETVIYLCLTPTVVVFQLYRGVSTERRHKPIPVLAALIHMRYIRYILLETMSHSFCFLDRGGPGWLNNEIDSWIT